MVRFQFTVLKHGFEEEYFSSTHIIHIYSSFKTMIPQKPLTGGIYSLQFQLFQYSYITFLSSYYAAWAAPRVHA